MEKLKRDKVVARRLFRSYSCEWMLMVLSKAVEEERREIKWSFL